MQIINNQQNDKLDTVYESGAFRYGEGFFTTTAVKRFIPLWLEDHIKRLHNSLLDFGMGEICTDELSRAAYKWVREHPLEQGWLRIMAWNEAGEVKLYINGGSLNDIKDQQFGLQEARYFRHSSQPLLAYKSFNYWMNNIAYQEALKQGYNEVVFLNERGEICEGSRSNIYWVQDGLIFTPDQSCGLLPGICREKVLEAAHKLGLEVRLGEFQLTEFKKAQEVFITNSVRGIIRVSHLENICCFNTGPITKTISEAYNSMVKNYLTEKS